MYFWLFVVCQQNDLEPTEPNFIMMEEIVL